MRVVVVGGGLAGTACALHLRRDHGIGATVVEPRAALGAGVAYSTQDPAHRINVPARLMSVFSEDSEQFDRWLRDTGEVARDSAMRTADDRLYPARAAFGRYVAELARNLDHRRARALSAARDGAGFRVALDGGATVAADVLVLATSHPAAALPRALAAVAGDARLVRSPWGVDLAAQVDPAATVAVVGTGLTMADALASLRAGGHHGPVVAISRRGLLPRRRSLSVIEAHGSFGDDPARTAAALVRRVRAAARGVPWERAIEALRQQATPVWQALSFVERRRFLRHVRPFWDAHRYPCAPQADDLIRADLAAGRLRVVAGSLVAAQAGADALTLTVRRHGGLAEEVAAGLVVNCTGPAHADVVANTPVLASLRAAGLLVADPLGLGVSVDALGQVLDPADRPVAGLFVAGPLARGTFGELIGLPQVSNQPRAVAAEIARLRP